MLIKKILREAYHYVLSILPTTAVIYIESIRYSKKIPNLSNPSRFNEKIQCLKFNKELEKYHKYADKYEVRRYIEKTIGKRYLNKLIGVYDNVEDIDFYSLPNKFTLKCTHGSGYNILCSEVKDFDIVKAKKKLREWMKENFYSFTREPQYKLIKPRIICEEYLEDTSGTLKDYKFLCFKGEPKFIETDIDRYKKHMENYYDIDWNKLNMKSIYKNKLTENYENEISKPSNLEEMIFLAKKLSKNFNFVRVDFYSVNGKTIFGELTFIPASGFEMFIPDNINYELGKLLN